jgi:hypothetical protein
VRARRHWPALLCGPSTSPLDTREQHIGLGLAPQGNASRLFQPVTTELSVQIRVTPKRILFGLALSLVFALQTFGNISRGRWPLAFGALFGIGAVVLAFSLAFTAQRPGAATAQNPVDPLAERTETYGSRFRNHLLIFAGSVVVFFILFKILDTFHVSWRQWLR